MPGLGFAGTISQHPSHLTALTAHPASITPHIHFKVGDSMEAKGPVGHIEYNGRGNFKIGKVRVRTTVVILTSVFI